MYSILFSLVFPNLFISVNRTVEDGHRRIHMVEQYFVLILIFLYTIYISFTSNTSDVIWVKL